MGRMKPPIPKKGLKHILLPASSARFLKQQNPPDDWPSDFASPYHLYIIFLVILFSVFFLNAHIQVYEKKQQQQLKHLLVVKKFFHPKSKPRKKLVHQKAWDSHRMTRIKKIDPKKPIPPPPKNTKTPFLQLCTL